MTKKVSFSNKLVRAESSKYIAILSAVISFGVIFIEIPNGWRLWCGIIFIILCVIIYISVWMIANKRTKIKLDISGTSIWIKSGNLFEQEGLKVIPFNEYYDTQVDDKIINHYSLNGQYIDKYWNKPIAQLDELIFENKRLKESIIENDVEREGKPTKYRLGSLIVIDDEYVLTAFSKFNKDNDAQLTVNDYLDFLIQFWNRINSIYAQKKVVVPIFGSGITRFKNGMGDINENELLRIMIWTFKVSKIKFEYPADLSIIIHPDKIDKIDIFSLKEEEE
ncbi:macro domain-containing protein [Enterococcus hirae]|uniref:macro domain-containing protein n=2 Tax=Enterococcus TaxID=1350 RepID=UPI000DEBA5CB|nr:macro domain-containing protein [Enterococcus hirae]EMF0150342.1 hypothetical protein [Enterococcus hirae]EMF0383605.1 hypothetical protein [Enterococcus hirae]EMF0424567.1 hypothetical protein [Enterococcus hirae]EMF0436694.1 hypothetical protein [Enterococcus hirae]EMF0484425.1 hypothetical protein [Enterococcus hirae]